MNPVALRDIAFIQLGYSFREGLSSDPNAPVRVVQMRDLRDDHIVDLENTDRVDLDPPTNQWLQRGDILVRSRGESVTSAIVDADVDAVIAAAPLLRVRVTSPAILPQYLNWIINQEPSQVYFAKNIEGSNVKMMSRRALEDLPIEVPPVEHQEKVIHLAGLATREKRLVEVIGKHRDELLSHVMLNYVKGGASQ